MLQLRFFFFSLAAILSLTACRNFNNFWENRQEDNNVKAVAFAPAAGSYISAQNVTLTSATSGAVICYTTDGVTTPVCNATTTCSVGTTFSAPIPVATSQVINAVACKAGMSNSALASGVYTLDNTPPTISLTAPASSTFALNYQVTYTTNEACNIGTITWTRTGGVADGGSPHVQSLVGAELMSGTHTGIVLTNSPVLVEEAIYSVAFNCTDLAGNVATTSSVTNVTYDLAAPVISGIAPANNAFVSTAKVSYSLSEACQSGNVTWTRTGGTADGASPHVQALVAGEMTIGAHTNITLSNNPTLVSGTVYTVGFNCSDPAARAATTMTSTNVTFDNIVPVISATAPANSANVNNSLVSYTFSETCQTASVEWIRTGGNADGATHLHPLSGPDLTSGAHAGVSLSPTLVSGTIYSIVFNCADATGNGAAPITVTNVTYDTVVPVVSSVTSALADGSYTTGQVIAIQVIFSKPVNVTGTPQLTISTGTPSTTVLNYASGTGTSMLVFNYTVTAGNISADLDYASTTALALNGGTILDAALNSANLTLVSPGTGGSLGGSKNIVIDTAPPIVSSVTSGVADGSYGVGQVIGIQVVMSKPVNVTGTPQLTISTGSPATTVLNYVSGTGTTILQFNYTVVAGNTSVDLDYASTAALALNGGTIRDAALNNAVLTLVAPGSSGSLGFGKNLAIDGIVPVISAVAPAIGAYVDHTRVSYTLSETCATGSVTWTRTGGAADGTGAPPGTHTQALTGAELSSGSHTGIVLTNNPTLIPGVIYSIAFNCSDAANNAATTITQTNVSFEGVAIWARSTITGPDESKFYSVATDSMGNVYAVGYQDNGLAFNYGSGNVTGPGGLLVDSALIVKYDASGTALWAKTITSAGSGTSAIFRAVAVNSAGTQVYAVGNQNTTATHNYGSGITATGTSSGSNAVLVAFDAPTGNTLWARTTTAGIGGSRFLALAVDTSGNINVVGYQTGAAAFNYGSGTVTAPYSGNNSVIVQYNNAGSAMWARTLTAASGVSQFNGVAVDSSGNIYAAGQQDGTTIYTYFTGVSATASGGAGAINHTVLVKYNSTGTPSWAVTNTAAVSNKSLFYSVAVDTSGNNIYAVGGQIGTSSFTYGATPITGTSPLSNAMIVKYNNAGTVLQAKTTTAGSDDSVFYFVAVSPSGDVYAGGAQNSTIAYNYGSGPITGTATGSGPTGQNALLVKYDPSPTALWAKTVISGPAAATLFNSLAIDNAGNVFAPGMQSGTGIFNYGPATVSGTYATTFNALLVKYR